MKDFEKGLVSIITPSYNTARFIEDTIKSVLSQTYQNWEMLIVDDCSSDNTDEIIKSVKDSRIKYIKNEKNSGTAISRNTALRIARGEWIAFLDSDDLWMPDKLERQIDFMKKHSYEFTCTKHEAIDENSNKIGIVYTSPKRVGIIGMHLYCWPGCLTVMYHKPAIGLIQINDLKKNNDYALWLKVIKKSNCYYLDENLGQYRVRTSSISHDKFSKLIKSHYMLFREGEGYNALFSAILMGLNMVFGAIKKVFYDKKGNRL